MATYDLYVRLESPHDQLSWRGSLTAFSKENSLTPGQMFELYSQLEQAGAASLSAYGADRYTLRREEAKHPGTTKRAAQHPSGRFISR